MHHPARRLAPIVLIATIILAACAGSASPSASAGAGTASPAVAVASASPAASALTAPTANAPSGAPRIDLSTLAGNWIGSIENVRLNDARGTFQGGTITVAGDQILLTYAGGKSAVYGRVGPTTISNCKPNICLVQGTPSRPMSVAADGTVVVPGLFTPDQTCGAPAVADGGVVVFAPGGNKISYLSGALSLSGGTCEGGSWHAVWTQVLTRAQ